MKRNVSLNGEDVLLKKAVSYYAIDALYLDNIALERNNLDLDNLERELRTKVFLYTDLPFVVITPSHEVLKVDSILRVKDVLRESPSNALSSDTGLIMLVNCDCLFQVVEAFSYGKLVESSNDLIDLDYWDSLVGNFDYDDCALIYISTGRGVYSVGEA